MATVTVSFALDARTDRDILRWLEQQDNKSAAIRSAIRCQIGQSGVTLGDVYEAIQELRREGLRIAARGQASSDHPDEPSRGEPVEPPDVVANLDRLGLSDGVSHDDRHSNPGYGRKTQDGG